MMNKHMKIVSGILLSILLYTASAWGFTLTTQPPENVTAKTVTAHGVLVTDSDGNPASTRGFCYGTKANPDRSGLHTSEDGLFDGGTFSGCIIGLKPNMVYHVRAYAYSSPDLISYGNDVTFTTCGSRRNNKGLLNILSGW